MNSEKRITIHDVARLAGVSHTTVSWVIHDDRRISPATKEKVHKAIQELNYHPNHAARSLVRGKTNTIAILASFYTSAFETEIMRGIEQGFAQTRSTYGIVQYATRRDDLRKTEILEQIVFGRRADAVICLNVVLDDALAEAFIDSAVPIILVETSRPRLHSVRSDSYSGGYLATRHLLQQGRRRIAFIGGALDSQEESPSARDRWEGYRKALEEQGLHPEPDWYIPIANYYFEEGRDAVDHLISAGMDSVFSAAGDMVALGIMDGARKRGLTIPDDLAVVGYDNLAICDLVQPGLSTIAQPLQDMGLQAFTICHDSLLTRKKEPVHTVYQPRLVVRGSS